MQIHANDTPACSSTTGECDALFRSRVAAARLVLISFSLNQTVTLQQEEKKDKKNRTAVVHYGQNRLQPHPDAFFLLPFYSAVTLEPRNSFRER